MTTETIYDLTADLYERLSRMDNRDGQRFDAWG